MLKSSKEKTDQGGWGRRKETSWESFYDMVHFDKFTEMIKSYKIFNVKSEKLLDS